MERAHVGPSGGQMREGRRRKGSFPLQGAPTKQMAPTRANPEGKGQIGRMTLLRSACLECQAAPPTPSPTAYLPLACVRSMCEQPLGKASVFYSTAIVTIL